MQTLKHKEHTMATTQTMKIVRKLAGKEATIFNDKLVDGTRSVKVWGWGHGDYVKAQKELERAGLKARLMRFDKYSARAGADYTQTRLHVEE